MAEILADRLLIPQSMRNDFIKIGRGHFVPMVSNFEGDLKAPAFLEKNSLPASRNQPPFVERHHALTYLNRHLSETLKRSGRMVFIVGEAGRGKTRLMWEFARRTQELHDEIVVLFGNCNAQTGHGSPYQPFKDILNMLSGDLEVNWSSGNITKDQVLRLWNLLPFTINSISHYGPGLIDTLVPGTALVQRIIPYLSSRSGWLEEFMILVDRHKTQTDTFDQSMLLDHYVRVLQAVADRTPLLLILDDLQWIDDASCNLLFHLGRRLTGSPILILGAFRPSEIALGRPVADNGPIVQHRLEPVINEFKRTFGDIQLDLGTISSEEGRAFIEAILDSEPNHLDRKFRESLYQHTKGHPLFTVEIFRNMQKNGNLIQDENGEWVENPAISAYQLPARVEAVIEQRLDHLQEPMREILNAASVEGEIFTAQVLARVTGINEQEVLHILNQDLEKRHHLVYEQGEIMVGNHPLNQYIFNHSLFQMFIYNQLSNGQRRLIHQSIGETLEEIVLGSQQISTLLFFDQSYGESSFTDDHVEFAGIELFGFALVNHFWLGQDWLKAAVYAIYCGNKAMKSSALRESLMLYDKALLSIRRLPDPPLNIEFEAITQWARAAFPFRPYSDQIQQLEKAEIIARDLNDNARLVYVLNEIASVYLAKGLWTKAGPYLLECQSLAEESGNKRLTVQPAYFKALMAGFVDPAASLKLLNSALDLARQFEDRTIEALSLASRGQVQAQLGEFSQSGKDIKQAQSLLSQVKSPLTDSDVDLLASWTYLAMGDLALGLKFAQRSVEKAIAADNMECICSGYNAIGFIHLENQQVVMSIKAFEESISRSETIGATIHQVLGQAGLAAARFFNGQQSSLRDLQTALNNLQKYQNFVGAASADHLLGICLMNSSKFEDAERHLLMACDFYRKTGISPYLIRSLVTLIQLFEKQKCINESNVYQKEVKKLREDLCLH